MLWAVGAKGRSPDSLSQTLISQVLAGWRRTFPSLSPLSPLSPSSPKMLLELLAAAVVLVVTAVSLAHVPKERRRQLTRSFPGLHSPRHLFSSRPDPYSIRIVLPNLCLPHDPRTPDAAQLLTRDRRALRRRAGL